MNQSKSEQQERMDETLCSMLNKPPDKRKPKPGKKKPAK
jgi:hypothetical protein